MMPKKSAAILLLIFSIINISLAQHSKTGWNLYTSMKDVRDLSIKDTKIWAASSGGLFTFDYNAPSTITKYTSIDGMLSNDLTSVIVDHNGNIWAGGIDGSLDLYKPVSNIWQTSSDIANSNEPSKAINDIFQYGDYMFLSTDFSIIKFSINSFEIVDQPYIYLGPLMPIKTPVYKTIVVNDTIWAATKNGIAYANINNYLPIQSSWRDFNTSNSALITNMVNAVAYFNNKIFFGTDSGMVYYDNGTIVSYTPSYNGNPIKSPVKDLTVSNNKLYVVCYKTTDNIFKIDASNLNSAQLAYSGLTVNAMTVINDNDYAFGTANKGVTLVNINQASSILPNGPNSNLFEHVTVDQNSKIWAVSGGDQGGVFNFDGSSWKIYTTEAYPQMKGNDFRQVYASRNGTDIWASGFGEGLLKITGDSVFLFDDQNSILKNFGGQGFVLVEGVGEDNNGNLWVINRATTLPFVNFTQGVAYPNYESPVQNTLIYMVIDSYNTKWMTFPSDVAGSEKGIYYLNESTGSNRIIRAPNLGADMNSVFNIAIDKNGEIWVATDNGIAIIRDPYQVIANPNSIPSIEKMRIIENGLSTPLTEHVTVIRVDALNNKWIGTNSNGLLYLSSDGSTILKQFNTSNSPLTDNKINNIAVDGKNGKVYFATQKGLLSYQTVAVEALTDCDQIKTSPSPYVIPNDNLLTINGLVEESSVKILSISGTLVREFESPGGRIAQWDGRDNSGQLVSSGIYIIVGYNKDGSKACTGKVAVVKK
jgi:ligand-binding sensor domain-containing protein